MITTGDKHEAFRALNSGMAVRAVGKNVWGGDPFQLPKDLDADIIIREKVDGSIHATAFVFDSACGIIHELRPEGFGTDWRFYSEEVSQWAS